jgi:hypothetical protein
MWEQRIFGKEKIIDPKGKLEREIALLTKWQGLLATTLPCKQVFKKPSKCEAGESSEPPLVEK